MIYSLYIGYYFYYYFYYGITLYYGYKIGYSSYYFINNIYYYIKYPFIKNDIDVEMIPIKKEEENNDWILLKKN